VQIGQIVQINRMSSSTETFQNVSTRRSTRSTAVPISYSDKINYKYNELTKKRKRSTEDTTDDLKESDGTINSKSKKIKTKNTNSTKEQSAAANVEVKEIKFIEPPTKETQMDAKLVKKYYDKLVPYGVFEANWLRIGDDYMMHKTLEGPVEHLNREQVNKWYTENKNIPQRFLFKKTADLKSAYMWHAESTRLGENELTPEDKQFIKYSEQDKNKFIKKEFLAYHACPGYHGFFRPDLNEVIHLIRTKIVPNALRKISRIYVTTEMYPSDKVYECYDRKKDMHKAKTTIFYKNGVAPREPRLA